MATGWNAKLIILAWLRGEPISMSIGLAIAARHACERHMCIVLDEQSRPEYIEAVRAYAYGSPAREVVVGEAEAAMAGLVGVDFLVVDRERRDFTRVLRVARLSTRGAVLACKGNVSGFRWHGVLVRGTCVVRTVLLPMGKGSGLDIAHIGSKGTGPPVSRKGPSRWIKHIVARSGQEHLFRW